MIIEWAGGIYHDGPGRAFPAPTPAPPLEAAATLLYNLWGPVRVENGGAAGNPASYTLLYNLWGPVRAEYAGSAPGAALWETAGTGGCLFQAEAETQLWWRCDGDAVTAWFLQAEPIVGFLTDGSSTCEFLGVVAAAGGFVAQGGSTCTFVGVAAPPSYGFRADGKASCSFLAAPGTGEECLTPPAEAPPAGAFPNWVF